MGTDELSGKPDRMLGWGGEGGGYPRWTNIPSRRCSITLKRLMLRISSGRYIGQARETFYYRIIRCTVRET